MSPTRYSDRPSAVPRLALARPRLRQERAVRILLEQHVELLDRLVRLGLVAPGLGHLRVVAHRQLELGVVGARAGREERQELAVFVDGQHLRRRRAVAQVGVGEPQLGIGAVRALRVGVDQRLEELAGREPALLCRAPCCRARTGTGPAGWCRAGSWCASGRSRRRRAATASAGTASADAAGRRARTSGQEHKHHRVVWAGRGAPSCGFSQAYSAASPSASDVCGLEAQIGAGQRRVGEGIAHVSRLRRRGGRWPPGRRRPARPAAGPR